MKDINKYTIDRKNSGKRNRRRQRSMNLYIMAVILLVAVIGISMSYTFLFNIENRVVIVVSGSENCSDEEIQQKGNEVAEHSGIYKGDNLLRVDSQESAEKILDEVVFVETVEINKRFPSTIEIKVAYCVPSFNVEYDGGVLVVSKLGKILENNSFLTDGLPTIYGISPAETEEGKMLCSDSEHQNEALSEIMQSIPENNSISSIDMSDEFGIVIGYTNGTIFKMGNWNDAEYKLNLAQTVIEDSSINGKKGYITMIGSNQCSFRSSDEPVTTIGSEQSSIVAGENQEGLNGESNPEQEAIFSEFNSRENTTAYIEDYYQEYDNYNYDYNYSYDDYNYNWGNDAW